MRSISWRLAVAVTAPLLVGCIVLPGSGPGLVGAGEVKTETRQVAEFTRVDVSGGLILQLTIGSPLSVQVAAQENLLPITTTTVADGKLTARTTQQFSTTVGIKIVVTAPTISEISVSDGVLGTVDGLAAADLRVTANAGAILNVNGTAQTLNLDQNAGAVLNGTNFGVTNATVQMSSGAIATFAATGTVTGAASSGAILNIRGTPTSVNVTASSGAIVNR